METDTKMLPERWMHEPGSKALANLLLVKEESFRLGVLGCSTPHSAQAVHDGTWKLTVYINKLFIIIKNPLSNFRPLG